jgi:hypothetical protein
MRQPLPPSFFELERRLIALGRRQRMMAAAQMRLAEFSRQRELDGARRGRVLADFRKWRHRLTAALDPYALKASAASGSAP